MEIYKIYLDFIVHDKVKLFSNLPVLDPWPTVQLLGPVVLGLLGDVPVVGSDGVGVHPGFVLTLVSTLPSDATVDDDIEAVNSLRSEVPRQRLRQHPLGCLGGGKTHL